MRRRLALVFLAVTLMLVLGLLVPLAMSVRSQAELRALARAQADARAIATSLATLASTTGELPNDEQIQFVLFTYNQPEISILVADGTSYGSPPEGFDEALARGWEGESFVARGEHEALALVPVSLGGPPSILVTAYVSEAELEEGVSAAWAILGGLGVLVTLAVVPVGNSLATTIVRPVEALSRAARSWTSGNMEARVLPEGPPELIDSGEAFNALVVRLSQLLTDEREKIADVSHRLRTPLTALRLQAETVTDREQRAELLRDVDALENTVTDMIKEVRNPASIPGGCDLVSTVKERVGFWEVAAMAQRRAVTTELPTRPVAVKVSRPEVVTIVDTLVQNVLRHTPEGTSLVVGVEADPPVLVIRDRGPGFASRSVLRRGQSSNLSTGLGLDIVRKIAEASGGSISLANEGGAVVRVRFG